MSVVSPKPREHLDVRQIDGETVILDRSSEEIHTLNESASFVWSKLDGETELGAIAAGLAAVYSIDTADAQEHVESIISQFKLLKLIDNAGVTD